MQHTQVPFCVICTPGATLCILGHRRAASSRGPVSFSLWSGGPSSPRSSSRQHAVRPYTSPCPDVTHRGDRVGLGGQVGFEANPEVQGGGPAPGCGCSSVVFSMFWASIPGAGVWQQSTCPRPLRPSPPCRILLGLPTSFAAALFWARPRRLSHTLSVLGQPERLSETKNQTRTVPA